MPAVLPNTTTTNNYKDVQLGGDAAYDHGNLVVANNPVSLIVESGPDRGSPTAVEYPYVTPTTVPLVRGARDYIIGVKIKSAILNVPAQVSGFLLEPGVAGLGVGSAFTSSVSPTGAVSAAAGLTGIVESTGAIIAGTGFSVVRNAVGDYTINFTSPFASTPDFLVTALSSAGIIVNAFTVVPTAARVLCWVIGAGPAYVATDSRFNFSANPVA